MSYLLAISRGTFEMPRPRRDGTPARAPNRRRLSDAFIKVAKLNPKRVVLYWDTQLPGLVLCVQPTGNRSWKCIYSIRGRGPRWYHIGNARSIAYADARKIARKIAGQVAAGGDPHGERAAVRGRGSFEQVSKRYVEERAKKQNKSWRQADALVTRYVIPHLGRFDVGNIRRADVKSMLASIEKPILANQVLAATSAIFNWCVLEEVIENNPCRGIARNITTDRERTLSDSELSAFWPHLSPALRAILLTGQRPGEIIHMCREHVKDEWWEMPGDPKPELSWPGTKNGASHRVWLSAPVMALLPDVLMGGESIGQLQRTMRIISKQLGVEKVTPHDLRRTFATSVTRFGHGEPAMDRILNHRKGGVSTVYNRYGYESEDQRIMEDVAGRLVAIAEGTNVVALRR
jgi:integrase